ncbi:hypothetical protein [Pseudenhygromyxa sp. WMMC2535]|uniref:hypothetical protein n=1 Tax=Pseudenhygromyxa sp. WMMC2535 TaxID=2712867 RepID=UPI0020D0BAB5|nr:hypothetical protein [Pseudenhygromyxa sp. WMMC2535]
MSSGMIKCSSRSNCQALNITGTVSTLGPGFFSPTNSPTSFNHRVFPLPHGP